MINKETPDYSLDVESVRALEALAQRWNVSKSEVLRRAVRMAAAGDAEGNDSALDALDRLQISLRERRVDLPRWARDLQGERRMIAEQEAAPVGREASGPAVAQGAVADAGPLPL